MQYSSTVKLVCIVHDGTLPISVAWQSPNGNTTTSTLTSHSSLNISITPTTNSHYGTYTCTAINIYGSDTGTLILVEPEGKSYHHMLNLTELSIRKPIPFYCYTFGKQSKRANN